MNPTAEQTGNQSVRRKQKDAFLRADLFGVAFQNAQIQNQNEKNDAEKHQPDPYGLMFDNGRHKIV